MVAVLCQDIVLVLLKISLFMSEKRGIREVLVSFHAWVSEARKGEYEEERTARKRSVKRRI